MATRGPWSVKGIDNKAREAARQAAQSEGITLGEYLNRLLLEGEREDNNMSALEQKQPSNDASSPFALDALDKLTRRIESIEAKSTLAITGIDQSVVGLLSRLENNENSRSAMEGRLELAADELRNAQHHLEQRIERMEGDDTGLQNLRALKSLEAALGRLASRVEDEHEDILKTRKSVESVNERMDDLSGNVDRKINDLTGKVETTLDTAANSIAKAVEQAELRTEGATRHLSERMSQLEADLFEEKRGFDDRFSAIESNVEGTLSSVSDNIDRLGERMVKTETHAVKAMNFVEEQTSTLSEFAERLNRAETTTDAALRDLEQHFHRLDTRLGEFDNDLDGGIAGLKKHLEDRVKQVAIELADTITAIREDMVNQIEAASGGPNDAFAEMNNSVAEMHKRMKKAEKRQNDAIEAIAEEFARLTQSLDRRVGQIEGRNDSELTSTVRDQIDNLSESLNKRISELEMRDGGEGFEAVSKQMNELADALDRRVNASEERSANAIKEFTEHVTTLTRNLSAKQDKGLEKISGEIKASEERQNKRFETALSSVKDRISQVEEATASSVSPIQKAMASLADRLQAVEEFSNPPGAPRASALDMELPSFEDTLNSVSKSKPEPAALDELEDDFDWDTQPEPKASDQPSAFPDIPDIPDIPETKTSAPPAAEPDDPWAADDDIFTTPSVSAFDSEDDDDFSIGDNFTADLPSHDAASFDLDAADMETDDLDDGFGAAPAPNDYLARARAAANAGTDNSRSRKHSPARKTKSGGGNAKIPLVAAASVLALSAAGTAGYMMMRGKQDAGDNFVAQPSSEVAASISGTTFPETPEASEDGEDIIVSEAASEISGATPAETETADVETAPSDNKTASAETSAASKPARTEPARTETRQPAATPPTPKPEPTRASTPRPTPTPTISAIGGGTPTPTPAPTVAPAQTAPQLSPAIAQYQQGMTAINEGRIAEGAALIRQSADAGQPIAQYRMAKLYERGQGVPRDLTQSRFWTEKAANGGNVKAMHDLAVFYAEGEGGPQSYPGAVQWFRKAADHGLVDSQYNLGVLYEQGLGVTANPAEALYWFRVANKLGDNAAASKVRELAPTVSKEEAEKTARLAGQYRPQPSDAEANGRFPTATPASTSSGAPNSFDPALISEAQVLLNALGYNAGAPDGQLGANTRQAILSFQAANGLPQSGQVTPTLVRQLRAATA